MGVEGAWTTRGLEGAREICGREVVRVLAGGRSVLARERGAETARGPSTVNQRDDRAAVSSTAERLVVMKGLPRDCLVRGELHGYVRERLLRVRELADVGVAPLYGVEEDAVLGPVLVWGWVEGSDLATAMVEGKLGLLPVARGVVGAVEKLHLLGIVHGALHLRNVIVTSGVGGAGHERFVLTHISPLVIDDVRRDAADVVKLLRELNARPGGEHSAAHGEGAVLARIIAELGPTPDLSVLRDRLLRAQGAMFVPGTDTTIPNIWRFKSFWAAIAVALLGILTAASAWIWAGS